MYAEAEKQARDAATRVGEDPEIIAALVRGVANPAERPNALKLIDDGKVGRYSLREASDAFWYALLGANDRAPASLEHWVANTDKGQLFAGSQILWSPAFDPVRSDPRFQTVLSSTSQPVAAAQPEHKQP